MDLEQIKTVLLAERQRRCLVGPHLLSTGSTLVNLAISGDPHGGIPAGKYVFFVGDSASGKTFLALTCFAEAQLSKHFSSYRMIFDNVEDGALMDIRRYFGAAVADRLEPPAKDDDGEPLPSTTIEDFYFNIDDALQKAAKSGVPFIYVLDSMDSLSSDYEGKKFLEAKTASRKGKDAKGSYGDGKAKTNSTYLRRVVAGLRDTGSILIIICQTRDNIDAGLFEPSKTRSGGHALQFYAAVELWTGIRKRLKRTVHDKERQVGIVASVAVKKNRITGKEWQVTVPLYWSHGIDDVGGCVDYLAEEKHWPVSKEGKINGSGDFKGCEGNREKVVRFIEENGMEDDLRDLVAEVWAGVEQACRVKRKPRYE